MVFKHAVKAVDDISFACELHRTCVGVSAALAAKLERELVVSFTYEGKLWEYLSNSKVEAVLDRNEKRRNRMKMRGRESREERGKCSSQLLHICCRALVPCLSILEEVIALDELQEGFTNSLVNSVQIAVNKVVSFLAPCAYVFNNEMKVSNKKKKTKEENNENLDTLKGLLVQIDTIICKLKGSFLNDLDSLPPSIIMAYYSVW